jgi:hypothetical protein
MEKIANAKIKFYILGLQPRENETDKANLVVLEKYRYKLPFSNPVHILYQHIQK